MNADGVEVKRHKRARKQSACQRCRSRKQGCDFTFPKCTNCAKVKAECIRQDVDTSTMPSQALQERVAYLEARLASMTQQQTSTRASSRQSPLNSMSPSSSQKLEDRKDHGDMAQVVGFLSLGGEPTYIGSSSGISLAANLSEMVQATVWNKVLSLANGSHSTTPVSYADIRRNAAGPPGDEFGQRLLDSYFSFTHAKYPLLVRREIMNIHSHRFNQQALTVEQKFDTFKLFMVYAIGATTLKLTVEYDSTPPEKFCMTALQYVSAAKQSHSMNNVIAMILLVIYHLRSPSNTGIWYMIGLAMRTCIDLGLQRKAHYTGLHPFMDEVKRRTFWSVYCLEKVTAITLGRPSSVADRDIDVQLPLNIDDDVQDPEVISTLLNNPKPDEITTLSLCIHLTRFRKIESRVLRKLYRVDRKPSELVDKIAPLLQSLEEWKSQLTSISSSHQTFAMMHYYRAVRLILQPFLGILEPGDPKLAQCLEAAGQICQIFKRLLSRESYAHSFVAVHSVYVAGMTMCYCLWLCRELCTFSASNDLRACSSVLHIMAERAPSVRKYRDVFEELIDATMEHLARKPDEPGASVRLRPDTVSHFTKAGDMVMQMMNHMTTIKESPTSNLADYDGISPFNFTNDGLDNFALGQIAFGDFDQGRNT